MNKKLFGRYFSWNKARDVIKGLGWKATVEQTWTYKNNKPKKVWRVYTSPRKNYPPKVKKIKI